MPYGRCGTASDAFVERRNSQIPRGGSNAIVGPVDPVALPTLRLFRLGKRIADTSAKKMGAANRQRR